MKLLAVMVLISSGLAAWSGRAAEDLELNLGNRSQDIRRIPGRFGYAWDFYRDPRLLTLDREYVLPGQGWGVSLWFRLDDPAGGVLIGSNRWQHFQLSAHSTGLGLTYLGGGGQLYAAAPYPFTPGLWYQAAVTQDAAGVITFYVDGQAVARHDAGENQPNGAAHLGTVGSSHINGQALFDRVFQGAIDRPVFQRECPSPEAVRAEWLAGNRTLPVVPMPRQVRGEADAVFARPSQLAVTLATAKVNPAHHGMRKLNAALQALPSTGSQAAAVLQVIDIDSPELPERLREYAAGGEFPTDGYVLDLTPERITLAAATAEGFYYGLLTLTQLLEQPELPVADLFDYPEFPLRAALVVVDAAPPLQLADWLKTQIVELSEQRIKYVMLRAHDWALIDRPEVVAALREMIDWARSCEMTVLPYLQSYSHAKGFLFHDPGFGHTVTVADEELTLTPGTPVALARPNVTRSVNTPLEVRAADGSLLVEDRDYRVIPGAMELAWDFPADRQIAFPWTRPYVADTAGIWQLEALASGALRQGGTVKVTYDVYGGGECTCPFSPEYQAWLAQCIATALELTGSDYICVGLDEIWQIRGGGRCCAGHALSAEETLGYAFRSAKAMVDAVRPGVKTLAFSDMLDPNQTPEWKSTDIGSDFAVHFDRDMIMMPWYYSDGLGTATAIESSTEYFLNRGFPVAGTAGKLPLNQLLWAETLLPLRGRYPVDGFVYTMWDASNTGLSDSIGFTAYAQMSWSPDRLFLPANHRLSQLLAELPAGELLPEQRRELTIQTALAEREMQRFATGITLGSLPINHLERLDAALPQARQRLATE